MVGLGLACATNNDDQLGTGGRVDAAGATSDTTTGSDSTSSSSGHDPVFIIPDDTPSSFECDLWTGKPCPRGEKCMPWDAMGGSSIWNATRCTPVAPDPAGPGEPCTAEGSGGLGIDDCEALSMCWGVDPETGQGTCVPFCMGHPGSATCDDPCRRCSITGSGAINLCFATCDPLSQPCPDGSGCYGSSDGLFCSPNASPPGVGFSGDPCEYVNTCQPGFFCANVAVLPPGCTGSLGCCTPFCDLTAEDACPDQSLGVQCVPWFVDGRDPHGCGALSHVGVCVLAP
jgi:hypothetical protein